MDRRVFLIFLTSCLTVALSADSHGWNDAINWLSLEEALAESQKTNQPIMLLIHKSWCGACKALKPKFAASRDIEELSQFFLMVNLMDNEEPDDSKYTPDGGYIPRIMFIREGEVMEEFTHEQGNPKYRYFYHNDVGIVKTMIKVVKALQLHPDNEEGGRGPQVGGGPGGPGGPMRELPDDPSYRQYPNIVPDFPKPRQP